MNGENFSWYSSMYCFESRSASYTKTSRSHLCSAYPFPSKESRSCSVYSESYKRMMNLRCLQLGTCRPR